ncbi:MAG: efflux RND transporter permease subunit [Pseudomonadota bacterium]
MNAIIDAAINRSRTVLSILALLLIAGTISYITIPKESNPDISIPTIYVSMHLDGVSPEDSERLLVRPMEAELQSIEGVTEISSNAYRGGGNVILEFEAGFDSDQALLDVREAVDRAEPELPEEAEDPTVTEVNFSLFPVIVVTLSGDIPERTLVGLARDLQDRLESLPSVLEANIGGDRQEIVEIIVDPREIESYGLNANDIVNFVSRSNRLVAAGDLDTGVGSFAINVPGLFEDVDDILTLPLAAFGDAVVEFQDVATIGRTFEDPTQFARVNGNPAVTIEVVKRTGENVIDTIAAIQAVVDTERQFWPEQVEVGYSQDQSEQIETMLADLQNNVLSAILLVMIVVVGALGLRTAGLVGIAIPGAFLTGILVLSIMGLTVNIVVLFSLILAVGLLVDGAIVVTELADRKLSEGLPRREAYAIAAKRMAWPITASTATTLAAFMPLLFWPGIVGEFMSFLPITLIATLTASLAMALIFIPTLGATFGKAQKVSSEKAKLLAAGEHGDLSKLGGGTGAYLSVLRVALRHPGKVVLLAGVTLIGTWMAFANFGTGIEFFPDVEAEQASILVHARGNLSIYEQDALVQEVEDRVLTLSDEFDSVYTLTGSGVGGGGEDVSEDVVGQITVEFADWDERRPAAEIIEDIRTLTSDLAGVSVETRLPSSGPPIAKDIELELSSRFPERLPEATARVRDFMDSLQGLTDVEDSRPIPGIEWELAVDRAQAAKFGLDVTSIGDSIKLVTRGLEIGSYRPDDTDEEVDILVRYPENWRTLEQLDNIRVVTGEGAIPISNFVTRTAEPLVNTLNRIEGERTMSVSANAGPGYFPDALVGQIREWLATEADLDQSVTVRFGGEDEEQQEAQAFLTQAFGVALFLMAIILVTQFNSFYSAMLILSAVIMSTVGVLLGLMITGQAFGIVMTGIGIIALAGIVVNNNIVLIDTYDKLKKQSKSPMDAILRTGAQRLRPVLLTTVTTMLGLMPMVFQINIDFFAANPWPVVATGAPSTQWWVQLATAVAFGLGFATLLTLLVTPSALMLKANWDAWRARGRARRAGLPVPGPASEPAYDWRDTNIDRPGGSSAHPTPAE